MIFRTTLFSFSVQYEKALLRGYVECCSNLTWCTNPQGCDQILCKEGLGCGEACSKCSWISCFNCNFPEVSLREGLGEALRTPCRTVMLVRLEGFFSPYGSVFVFLTGSLPCQLQSHVPVDGWWGVLWRDDCRSSKQAPGQTHFQALPKLPSSDREKWGLSSVSTFFFHL